MSIGRLALWNVILLSGMAGFGITPASADGPYFASGVKVGEATQDSVLVWIRLTTRPAADYSKLPILTTGLAANEKSAVAMPLDVVPGAIGQVRVHYRLANREQKNGRHTDAEELLTEWNEITAENDYIRQLRLSSLLPGCVYQYRVEARHSSTDAETNSIEGEFRTAPAAEVSTSIRFIVSTCQAVRSIDSGAEGHLAYRAMLEFEPHFFVHTGDVLYYDKAPLARTAAQARAKWNLMFSYGHNRDFHRQVSSYFMKDDHDTLKNDCWPGQKYGELTFDQGLAIFRQQVCIGDKTFRTIRWGKHVQIWMTENRDFRSPNRMPDGPDKTILGLEQKAWLKKTVRESDATFKFLISPGPLVGPDKKGKNDNHSNAGFATEGQELREFLAAQKNMFVICGDRHWQYCSKDPKTGLIELGCGPINDQHMFGGNPGKDPKFHRYFSAKGGFLGVRVDGSTAVAEWYGADGMKPFPFKVLHTESFQNELSVNLQGRMKMERAITLPCPGLF